MRHRLKDVAERAGVSVKTVSNVVNGYAHVRPATRARVSEAIAALDYRPNISARNLRRGRTGIIALAVPELDLPYFAELAKHVVSAAARHGLTVLIDQTNGDPEQERLVAAGIRDHMIDGLIFSPLALAGTDLDGGAQSTPMVLLGERVANGPADHVAIDNVAAARDVTAHLVARGRRRIAAIGAQHTEQAATARLRLAGYGEALHAAGLGYDEALIAPAAAWHRAGGAEAMAALLATGVRPDAVVCFNDTLALGAMRALYDAGLRVPDDVAVAGFDDIEDGRFSVPTLTTVAPEKSELARTAVDLLVERLELRAARSPASGAVPSAVTPPGQRTVPPRERTVPHRLIPRESTAG